jgi:hypothetical protein
VQARSVEAGVVVAEAAKLCGLSNTRKISRRLGRPPGKWSKDFAHLSQQGKSYRWKMGGAKAAVASSVSALERIGAETAEGIFC